MNKLLILLSLLLSICSCKQLKLKKENLTAQEFQKRADSEFSSQDYKGAIDDYTEAIDLSREAIMYSAVLYENRALCKEAIKNFKGAIDDFTWIIEKHNTQSSYDIPDPFLINAYLQRGICKTQINETNSACIDLRKARDLDYSEYKWNNSKEWIAKYCQ